MDAPGGPEGFDPIYFSESLDWDARVAAWLEKQDDQFGLGNKVVVERTIEDEDAGLRVVVNIGGYALEQLLENSAYLNIYERPVIGGVKREPTDERMQVDKAFGLDEDVYFGAVALGGTGVRYYGEFCLVLDPKIIHPKTQLVDRDSYDILMDPIRGRQGTFIKRLIGSWDADRHAMVLLKVLPEVTNDLRLMTAGTVSDLILKDQEFIEVHLRPDRDERSKGGFGPENVTEVRESPDEVAVATRLRERDSDGLRLTLIESELLRRREKIMRSLNRSNIPTRVVTQNGRGYQWK